MPLLSPSSVSDLPQTLPALIRRSAQTHGNRPAIIEETGALTYTEVLHRSEQVARSLIALGVQFGDRVAVWAPNMSEWILAACGAHFAGAILVPLNTRMKGAEAADILERSQAKVLFCIGNFLNQYYPSLLAKMRPKSLEHLVVFADTLQTDADSGPAVTWPDFLQRASEIPVEQVQQREARLDGNSTADLMFTSGTTGRPKGVMAAHAPTIKAFDVWSRVVGLNPGDHYLIVNPFFHTFGYKAGWVAAFVRGATVYPEQVFDAEAVLRRIERDQINFLPGPPTLFLSMLAHPRLKEFNLSTLRSSVTGAATVPPVLIQRMRNDLGIANVTTAYGLTECGGCATICDPTDSVETVASTCGHALPGTEVCCVDDQGKPVPAGQPGEVLLRGYHVMQGYFEDEAATKEAIDADGWLHTGDVGVLDERGYLRITDRLKDMFIVGGFNCYPAEIERLISNHPDVAQVAVVGIPDERMGEVGCACLITRSGQQMDEQAFIQWSRSQMANYKVPRHVLTFEQFPVNASNKVMKRDLTTMVLHRLGSH